MNVRSLFVSLFLVVLFFLGGLGIGIFYNSAKVPTPLPSISQNEVSSSGINFLSSKLVPTISAKGKVTKIEGNMLTITYLGDTRTISLKSDATVYKIIPAAKVVAGKPSYTTQLVTVPEIKVGSNIEIAVNVLSSGKVEVSNVIILPVAAIVPETNGTTTAPKTTTPVK